MTQATFFLVESRAEQCYEYDVIFLALVEPRVISPSPFLTNCVERQRDARGQASEFLSPNTHLYVMCLSGKLSSRSKQGPFLLMASNCLLIAPLLFPHPLSTISSRDLSDHSPV
ncbi:hypothetical protein Bpfe_000326 [Biomphalaria pfeifferi]|uniref:Uncharacterized protein n=1 Tax=Biomphalaria pfeifferi TaxID=112525 RepID=A0AAD8CDK3_BIOPF|nr:hypothetical protein Bpfe_000323 [Biomphalaria pfeifferi]KAK0070343.1 hypothetical protein Bpfe_000326 [Biomphalaria pfeifferi]